MKKYFSGALFSLAAVLCGDEVIATFDNRDIFESDIANLPAALQGIDPDRDPAGYRAAKQAAVAEYCGKLIFTDALQKYGIAVNRETAEKYISLRQENIRPVLLALADKPDFQRKCAIYFLLRKIYPAEIFEISENDIRSFYYRNIHLYRTPARADIGVIAVSKNSAGAAATAGIIRSRLLQGESFERVASEYPAAGHPSNAELQAAAANLAENDISPVCSGNALYFVVKKKKEHPAQTIPLHEAKAFIIEELSAAKDAAVLEDFFRRKLRSLIVK